MVKVPLGQDVTHVCATGSSRREASQLVQLLALLSLHVAQGCRHALHVVRLDA